MQIVYIGLIDNRFKYKVSLNGHTFDFHTGLGWTAVAETNPDKTRYVVCSKSEAVEVIKTLPKSTRLGIQYSSVTKIYRRLPTEADIFESLQLDIEAGQMSFSEFCDNFGYDNDSLKALDIYRACEDTAKKLRGFKFPETKE